MLRVLEDDFRRIPELLGRAAEPEPLAGEPMGVPEPDAAPIVPQAAVQLGLF
jgi:hypothetical protein